MSPTLSRLAAVPAAILLLLAMAGPAAAHAELVSSVPEDGAVLDVPPVEVVLGFSEGIDATKSSFRLLGPGGEAGTARPARDGAKVMLLNGLALAPGDYQIRWTVGSGDGHVERGVLRFTVLAPAPAPTAAATPVPAAPTGTPATSMPGTTTSSPAVPVETAPAGTSASSSPAGDPDVAPAAADGADVVVPIVAALALVAGVGMLVLRRSRRA